MGEVNRQDFMRVAEGFMLISQDDPILPVFKALLDLPFVFWVEERGEQNGGVCKQTRIAVAESLVSSDGEVRVVVKMEPPIGPIVSGVDLLKMAVHNMAYDGIRVGLSIA